MSRTLAELEMFVYRLEARVLILERKVNDFINSMQDDGK